MNRSEIVLSVGDTIVVGRQLLTVHKATENGIEFLIELLPEDVFPESETDSESSAAVADGPYSTDGASQWSSDVDQYSERFDQNSAGFSNRDSSSNRRMNRPR